MRIWKVKARAFRYENNEMMVIYCELLDDWSLNNHIDMVGFKYRGTIILTNAGYCAPVYFKTPLSS